MGDMADFKIRTSDRQFTAFNEDEERTWKGNFTFIQAADTQFGMIDDLLYNRNGDDNTWDAEIALAKKTVEIANSMKPLPRFFVVCGDLVHAFPGEKKKAAQEADFKTVYAGLHEDIPLVCVCGNHDIGNTPTHDSINNYQRSFGDDYFSFWVGGVKFLVLNSQFFEDDSQVPDLSKAQEEWLDAALEEGREARHLVIFQHIPIFLEDPEEPKQYFNLDFPMRRHLLEKFKSAGVRAIFCGHYHRNAGGFHGDMELVVTSAVGARLGDDPHGMRLVHICKDSIHHAFYGLADWPSEVTSQTVCCDVLSS